jgi:hypothetical protein
MVAGTLERPVRLKLEANECSQGFVVVHHITRSRAGD